MRRSQKRRMRRVRNQIRATGTNPTNTKTKKIAAAGAMENRKSRPVITANPKTNQTNAFFGCCRSIASGLSPNVSELRQTRHRDLSMSSEATERLSSATLLDACWNQRSRTSGVLCPGVPNGRVFSSSSLPPEERFGLNSVRPKRPHGGLIVTSPVNPSEENSHACGPAASNRNSAKATFGLAWSSLA